jgi:catalase (peroxidase I)
MDVIRSRNGRGCPIQHGANTSLSQASMDWWPNALKREKFVSDFVAAWAHS